MARPTAQYLTPPILNTIRNQEVAARVRMERTASQEIRDERADLKEAAEQSLNVIVDVGLDGRIRWASPSWRTVVGTPLESIGSKPIGEVLAQDDDAKNPFLEALESMQQDDSKSQIIRFRITLGPSSIYVSDENLLASQKEAEGSSLTPAGGSEDKTIMLEGQGIMVHDRASQGNDHVSILHTRETPMLT